MVLGWRGGKDRMHTMWIQGTPCLPLLNEHYALHLLLMPSSFEGTSGQYVLFATASNKSKFALRSQFGFRFFVHEHPPEPLTNCECFNHIS